MSPPVPASCLSVYLTAFQTEEFVLSSCSQWSSALTCGLPASIPPCMLGGQSPGTGSSAPSSGSASTSGSSFITGNTSQDLPLFPATNCTSQMMLWCGGRGSISLGEPSTPLCSPWHFYNPSSGSWVGWQPQPSPLTTCWFMVDTSPPPELPGATATVPHEGLLWWHAPAKPTPPGILFLYFFKESKIFQLQCGDAV